VTVQRKEEVMAKKKRILVACGTGMATSTAVTESLREALEDRGINVEMSQCKISEIDSYVDSFEPHAIVSTADVDGDYEVPVFSGRAFLTGVGEDEVVEDIAETVG
jgi:galactitol PTS system EIIB component